MKREKRGTRRKQQARRKHALQQARFVVEYLKDLNATRAAIRAGYSARSAAAQASVLLSQPKIAQAVAEGQAKAIAGAELTALRVLEEMRRVAMANSQDYIDAKGNHIPIQQLTRAQAAAVGSWELVTKNVAAGDGHTDTVLRTKLWDKLKALEMLGKHFALLTDQVQHLGEIRIRWQQD